MKFFLLIVALFAINHVNVVGQVISPTPELAQTEAAKTVYSCPMHPEVQSKKRGKCPKCKMVLVRQAASAAVTTV